MNRALLVATDGGLARLFERRLPLGSLSEIASIKNDLIKNLPESQHDRPGRVFESANSARHAYDKDENWRDVQKEKFVISLSKDLEKKSNGYKEIYLCCPPKILGFFRDHLSPHLASKVTREYIKDFVKNPLVEISEFIDTAHFSLKVE